MGLRWFRDRTAIPALARDNDISRATAVIGAAFVLSGLAHLAILNTPLNVLAFRLPNVYFSLLSGLILLTLVSTGG